MNRPLRVIDDRMEYSEFNHCKTIRANCVDCLYYYILHWNNMSKLQRELIENAIKKRFA